jgi:predicted  nucleic acid-binding Zn-ribbon protein
MDDEDEYDPNQIFKSVEALDRHRLQAFWNREEMKREDSVIEELQEKVVMLQAEVSRLHAACLDWRERCTKLELYQPIPRTPDTTIEQYKQLLQTYKDKYTEAMKQLDARGL